MAKQAKLRKYKYKVNTFLPWQRILFQCEKRYRIACCGRGSGKTDEAIEDITLRMAYQFIGNAAIICPISEKQGKMIYWQRLKDIVEQLPDAVDQDIKWHNDSEHSIKFKNGSVVYIFSGSEEAALGLRGQEFVYILLDEVADLPRWVWDDVIEPMTARAICKKVLFIGTPNGVNNVFHDLYTYGLNGNRGDPLYSDYASFHATAYDNPVGNDIKTLDLIKHRRGADSLTWRREYMAEFVGAEGAVFPRFGPNNITTRAVYYLSPDWVSYAAIDFGYTNGITILMQKHKGTGNLNIFGGYHNVQRGFREKREASLSQEEHLVQSIKNYNIQEIFVDCAGNQSSQETGKSLVQMMRQSGIENVVPVQKHDNDFRDYTEQIRFLILNERGNHLFITPEFKIGVESLYNCRYPDKIQSGRNMHKYYKDGIHDHFVDCLRYAVKALYPIQDNELQVHDAYLA